MPKKKPTRSSKPAPKSASKPKSRSKPSKAGAGARGAFKPSRRPKPSRVGSSQRPIPKRGPKLPLAPPPPLGPDTIRPFALAAVEAAYEKKAENATLLDVRRISSYADYVLLLSAESERQLDAIARAIEEKVRSVGGRLRSLESAGESNWLLMDFGDLVVHIFFRDARSFYDLEGLWSDAPRVQLGAIGVSGAAAR
jgi:ribosome-associated protein